MAEYFDEARRTVRPTRPLSEREQQAADEAQAAEERDLESLRAGRQSARIIMTADSVHGETWASVERPGYGNIAVPQRTAAVIVEFINGLNDHAKRVVGALISDDEKQVQRHLAAMFKAARKTVSRGARPKPFKAAVFAKILGALAQKPQQPSQAQVERAVLKLCDDSLSERTARNWAKDILKQDLERKQRGQ